MEGQHYWASLPCLQTFKRQGHRMTQYTGPLDYGSLLIRGDSLEMERQAPKMLKEKSYVLIGTVMYLSGGIMRYNSTEGMKFAIINSCLVASNTSVWDINNPYEVLIIMLLGNTKIATFIPSSPFHGTPVCVLGLLPHHPSVVAFFWFPVNHLLSHSC